MQKNMQKRGSTDDLTPALACEKKIDIPLI